MKPNIPHAPFGNFKQWASAVALVGTAALANAQTYNIGSEGINDTTLLQQGPWIVQNDFNAIGINFPNEFGEEQNIALYSFNGLSTLAPNQVVTSAFLNVAFLGVYPQPSVDSYEIVGLTQAYDSATVNWDNYSDHAAGALTNYGYIPAGIGGPDGTAYALDITAALNAYLHGDIVGIAFRKNGIGDPGENAHFVNFASAEHENAAWRPTLTYTVEAIPEPSAVMLLGAATGLGVLRRRRA